MATTQLPDDFEDAAPRVMRGTAAGADCQTCPFGRNGQPNHPVFGIGPADPLWIAVGESPGVLEVKHGDPFIGPSGGLVNNVLGRIGAKRESLWITNATLCMEPGASDDDKRAARRCCAPRLKNELAGLPRRPILALGSIAAQSFCGERFSITQMAGAHFEADVTGSGKLWDVVPTIHPAAILRGANAKGGSGGSHTSDLAYWNLLYDAQKVNMLARGRDIKFTEDILVEATDVAKAQKLIEDFFVEARKEKIFALDTETYVDDRKRHSALQASNAKISAIGLATTNYGISVAWNIITQYGKNRIAELLADPEMTVVMHNSAYDVPVLNQHGFEINARIEDTLLAHHNAFPGLAHGLQRVGTQFQLMKPWKAEFRAGEGTVDELLPYCAKDTLVTARIHHPLQLIIKRDNAEKTYEIDRSMARIAGQMHLDGVPISREVNAELASGFKKHIDETRAELVDRLNDPKILSEFKERLAFEQARRQRKHDSPDLYERIDKRLQELGDQPVELMPDAGDHVVALLKACGVPLMLTTATGRTSTKKDVLENVGNFPEVRTLLTYRENVKLLNTFCIRMFDRLLANGKIKPGYADDNDRIHPRWSVFKISGRWGSENPGAQNWPKADKKKGRPNLRSQVVARPGRQLVAFDAKQLEARVIALLSADPFLVGIFHNNRDIHTEFAKMIWPDFDNRHVDERKVLRDLVKRPEYCLAPGTRVLQLDSSSLPIEAIQVGQQIAGFTGIRRLTAEQPNKVIASKTLQQPCYRIQTSDGVLTASHEHLWMGRLRERSEPQWLRTDQLRIGDCIKRLPWASSGVGFDSVVNSVDYVGARDVIALQTSTETFIAEGFLSHNCSFYAGSPETAWKSVVRDYPNVTKAMVSGMVSTMHRNMPGVLRWHQNAMLQVHQTGEIRSAILGRRRCFPIKEFEVSEVVNFAPQSTAADIIDLGLHEIMQKLPDGAFPILQIHDAVVFECLEDDVDLVKQLVIECFTRQVTYNGVTMDFPVDAKSGSTWAEVN